MESWRPMAILVDTKGQTDFPRQWVVLTGPAETEALSGFLNFPSYATDISKVIQVQGWDEIEALEVVPNYFMLKSYLAQAESAVHALLTDLWTRPVGDGYQCEGHRMKQHCSIPSASLPIVGH